MMKKPAKPLNILDLYDYLGKVHEWRTAKDGLVDFRHIIKAKIDQLNQVLKQAKGLDWSDDVDMQEKLDTIQGMKADYTSQRDAADSAISTLERALKKVGKPKDNYMGWEDALDILAKFASGEDSVLHMHDSRTRRGTPPETTINDPDGGSNAAIRAEPEGRFDIAKLEIAARSVGGSLQYQETKAFSRTYSSYFLFVPYIVADYLFHNMEYSRGGYKNPPAPTQHCLHCGATVGDNPIIMGLGNHTYCSIDHAWLAGALGWDYKIVAEMKKQQEAAKRRQHGLEVDDPACLDDTGIPESLLPAIKRGLQDYKSGKTYGIETLWDDWDID